MIVGLIGEPFEIESKSQFDTATITFKIDQIKLGDIALDNLLFLWYGREKQYYESKFPLNFGSGYKQNWIFEITGEGGK